MSTGDPAVSRLFSLDSCALSDALDRAGLRGGVTGLRAVSAARRIAGRVMTVKLGLADGITPRRHLCTAAIEAAAPGDIIVVEHHARADVAGWGGILSTAAQVRGLAGTIVDGAVRDVDESEAIGYPVFARLVVPLTARGRIVEQAWNGPIVVGGVVVRPGDLVIADGSGVVFLPSAQVDEVLSAAEQIAAREAAIAAAIRKGEPVSRVLGVEYETMLG